MSVTDFVTPFYFSGEEQALARATLDTVVHSGAIAREPDGSLADNAKNFLELLNALAEGRPVAVIPSQGELSLSQAAEFLCVSAEYLDGLLDAGEIDSRSEGGSRKVLLESLIEYDTEATKRQYEALEELTRVSKEMGLYDDHGSI